MDGTGPRGTDFVQSLARGLAVIRAFDGDHPRLTLSEVARATGLTRAAARRFLLTLVELNYVRVDGRFFSLRPEVLALGYAYLSSLTLPEVAQPHLQNLAAAVHESCSMSVLQDEDIIYVARAAAKRIMTVSISIGTRFPAYATSMGRVLLAAQSEQWLADYVDRVQLNAHTARTVSDPDALLKALLQTRRNGFALVDQELEEGLRSLAVPVRGLDGTVRAAINVSTHVSRGRPDAVRRELLPFLLETAAAIETDLRRGDVAAV